MGFRFSYLRGFGLFFCILASSYPAFSLGDFQVSAGTKIKEVTFQNKWMDARVSYNREIVIERIALGNMSFLWPENTGRDLEEAFSGSSTILFDKHPLAGGKKIEMATEYTAVALPVKSASEAMIEIRPVNPGKLSIKKTFFFSAKTTIINVTAEIINSGSEEIHFFPAEVICQNANQQFERTPYLFAPINQDFRMLHGNNESKSMEIIKDFSVFSARYEKKLREAVFTNPKKWIVLYEGKYGFACAAEFLYPAQKIRDVSDNLILFVNGAGQIEKDGKSITRNENAKPFMRTMNVLGEVSLKPGETFTYTVEWGCSLSYGPIFNVDDGILTNTKLKVFTENHSLLILGTYGIPMVADIGLEFYDKEGKLIEKNYNISLNLDPIGEPNHPSQAVPHYPVRLSHQIGFAKDSKNPQRNITDDIVKVRVVLLDNQKNIIRVLEETTGPFQEYKGDK